MTPSMEHMEGSGGGFQTPFLREVLPPPSICSICRENAVSPRIDRTSVGAATATPGQCAAPLADDADVRLAEAIADGQQHRPRWQRHAACRGTDVAVFFPVRGASSSEARAICSSCPVLTDCRRWSLTQPEPAGILGGYGGRQRRAARRARGAP